MEKNTSSSRFSICNKIRQALESNPAFRAIHRIKQNQREPKQDATNHSNSPTSHTTHVAKNTAIQANNPQQKHMKVNKGGGEGGSIPIHFDYSTPTTSKGNGNSSTKVALPNIGNSEKGASTKVEHEPTKYVVQRQGKHTTRVEDVVLPTNKGTPGPLKGQHGFGMQGKISLDINDTFTEYIQRAKKKIRTVSNVGRGQGNSAPNYDAGGNATTNKMEHQKDQYFTDFILNAKKKLRTTSGIGKTNSLRRG